MTIRPGRGAGEMAIQGGGEEWRYKEATHLGVGDPGIDRDRILGMRGARCQGVQSTPTLSSSQRDSPERPNIGLDWNLDR